MIKVFEKVSIKMQLNQFKKLLKNEKVDFLEMVTEL